ncbi:hypothetical protein [Dietzia sp. NCCP-2495]|uniref:hypothetical protein n=1 Tax=Dietzia sp. NCCP-2495 TaxID=2934675 RepID=UPI00222F46BF|nr:hypothetical protein [Dietzia sp. NCCP-2495]
MADRPGVMEWVVALALAVFHGCYSLLIVWHDTDLWSLRTYSAALAVPGSPGTWAVVAAAAAVLLIVGTVTGRERLVAAGAALSGLWLTFFALMFGIAAVGDTTPVAQPGVIIYGCAAVIAVTRAGTAWGRR